MAGLKWCVFSALVVWASVGHAENKTVTLTSESGQLVLQGEILDFDGRNLSINSEYGAVVLDSTKLVCTGDACPNTMQKSETYRIIAPKSVADVLLPALIENFALRRARDITQTNDGAVRVMTLRTKADPDRALIFMLDTRDDDTGFDPLADAQADMMIGFRALNADEKAKVETQNPAGLGQARSFALALDAMLPVVAPPNIMKSVPLENVLQSIQETDPNTVLHPKTSAYLVSNGYRILTEQISTDISNDLYADSLKLGVVPFSDLGGLQVLDVTGTCGAMPQMSRRTIKAGDYPLTVPIYAHLAPFHHGPQVSEFLEYLASPAAQMVIQRAGFVDQMLEEIPIAAQGDRIAYAVATADAGSFEHVQAMLKDLQNAYRLTMTFRFDAGGADLDEQSKSQIERLKGLIKSGRFKGRTLYFVGFSDQEGDYTANLALSQNRAATVLQSVLAGLDGTDIDIAAMKSMGYGPVLPMACETTDIGKQINRRVEIWARASQ